ncbi:hypothetical protein NX059_006027 [Plenodomus lindquistii]|nr:hypothetical protein NX059_006027 [Plenodomus lindquistii]
MFFVRAVHRASRRCESDHGSLQWYGAQQLMPPPRLSRHLRPCHPRGSAHKVRCASWTARNSTTAPGGRHVSHPQSAAGTHEQKSATRRHDAGATAAARGSDHLASTPTPAETSSDAAAPAPTAAPSPPPPPSPPPQKRSWWGNVIQRLTSRGTDQTTPAAPDSIATKSSDRKVRSAHVDSPNTTKGHAEQGVLPVNPSSHLVQKRPSYKKSTNPHIQKRTSELVRDSRYPAAPGTPSTPSAPRAAASSQNKDSEHTHNMAAPLKDRDATAHLQGVARPPLPKNETSLTTGLLAMQSSLSELQNQVERLHAALEKISTAPITDRSMPKIPTAPVTDCSEPPATASASQATHRPLKFARGKPQRPIVLPGPKLARLQTAWTTYRDAELDLATYARGHPVLYPNNPDEPRKHLNPTQFALMLLWRKYRRYDGDIVKFVKQVIDLFPPAPSARPSPDALGPVHVAPGNSQDTGHEAYQSKLKCVKSTPQEVVRQYSAGIKKEVVDVAPAKEFSQTRDVSTMEKADQKVDTIAPAKTSVQTKNLGTNHGKPTSTLLNNEVGEQSLLEELFPEATSTPPPSAPVDKKRDQYPKLEPPEAPRLSRLSMAQKKTLSKAERFKQKQAELAESFQKKMEDITILQLAYCSTELTETDFRRLIPKGQHIEGWRRGGEFFKIIPGRDPLSLERMPFYYLLFRRPEAALAYQNNVARLHKLNALHQPTNILSAIPAPKGFLEDGEDLSSAVTSYNLAPTQQELHLVALMQPYSPALRALVERGGYNPIVPDVDDQGQRIWKVLMHIEGYEPTPSDLFKIFTADAWRHGMQLPLRTESMGSIHRLRDIVNLKTTVKAISSVRPRSYGTADHAQATSQTQFEDPAIQSMMAGVEEESGTKELNQYVMNRVYNRWVIDFDDESAARRFAINWHRRVLPATALSKGAWEDTEEERMCNTEVLW